MPQEGKDAFLRPLLLALAGCLAAFVVLATPARAADPYTIESNIAYGPANAQKGSNLLDVYVPNAESPRPRPVFVWIHGGGWFTGDKVSSTMGYKAKALVDAGFVFVSINYRLSPDLDGPLALSRERLRYPTSHQDAARALGWVNEHIREFGGNPNRLVIGGDSAGGQISSLLATKPSFLRVEGVSTSQVKGVLSLDAVGFNVSRMMTPAYERISAGFQKMMFNAFGTPAEERANPSWAAASPIRFAGRTDPPIFHVVPTSSADRWAEAARMAKRLGQRFPLVSWRIRTNHPGVVPTLGNPANDMGVTVRAIRFVKAAVATTRFRPVVTGERTVPTAGAGMTPVRLNVTSSPVARLVTCRMDGRRETLCPASWRLARGVHSLRVTTYSNTGKASMSRLVKIRVVG